MKKPKNKKDFIRILKHYGFSQIKSKGKHEKWSNGNKTIAVSNTHKEFHVIAHWEILKKAGIV